MRNGMTISREPNRLTGPLSSRVAEIRSRLDNAYAGAAIGPDEMDEISANLREMVGEARRLEDGARDADAAVPVAYDLACQTADELKVLRSLLAEMVTSHTPDAGDQVRCAFARARALLEKSEAVFLGKAKS